MNLMASRPRRGAGPFVSPLADAWLKFVVVLGAACVLLLLLSSVSFAASSWWHLSSGSRPGYLHAGGGQAGEDEVQEITVPLVEFEGRADQGGFILTVKKPSTEAEFFTEPTAAKDGFRALTAASVESALEGPYGAGKVHVTCKAPAASAAGLGCAEGEAGVLSLRVATEAGSEPVNATGFGLGEPTVKVVTAGKKPLADGEIVVMAANLGDGIISGAKTPVKIKDLLPPGLVPVGINAVKPLPGVATVNKSEVLPCSLAELTCEMKGGLAPYDQIEVRIAVNVEGSAKTGEVNHAAISGGGAVGAEVEHSITISSETTPFGLEDYELLSENDGGSVDTQAGSHPFQETTAVAVNQLADSNPVDANHAEVLPAGHAKDLSFHWPPGLVGNPSAVPRCTTAQFNHVIEGAEVNINSCPPQTAVGVAMVTVQEPSAEIEVATIAEPVFNLEPGNGEPARFGFVVEPATLPVFVDTAVRTGSDYGVTVTTSNISQVAGVLATNVTIWGVPGDPRHDASRGWACMEATRGLPGAAGRCHASEGQEPPAFLSLPTSCSGQLQTTVLGDTWAAPESPDALSQLAEFKMAALDGCNRLPFGPSLSVKPDGNAGSTPTGLNVDVHVPQEASLNANGLAEAAPRDITVTLPEGLALSPSASDGLQACSESLAGFTGFAELIPPGKTAQFTPTPPGQLHPGTDFCADEAKVGTVTIKTPILPNPIKGSVYLATQNENPFGSLIALYLIAEDPVSGVVIKLAGETRLSAGGQITTTFHDSPQAPFEDAEVHFFGGERAPLATPARCGPYTTMATLAPWSGNPPPTPTSTFNITSGPNGSPCPGAILPFSPSLTAGMTNINAGAFSPLTTTIARGDGQQDMQSVILHMPPGLEGILTGTPLCPEADANSGTCPEASRIGETTVSAGVGGDPVTVKGGRVYLTGKYGGAPFGLSIVNPVKAGPIDLEHDTSSPNSQPPCDCLVVRAKIEVDVHTAQLTVTTDPSGPHAIPNMVDGVPVQIKKVNVIINRRSFTFNPTNCDAFQITGTLTGYEGGSHPLGVPFQATNCATLKFAPKFQVSTSGKTSKADGASLHVKLSYPVAPFGSQANIARVKVDLPKQLPSRLTTLQKACTNAQFEANPAGCPAASFIGHARAVTPLLPVALEGPAVFVSHGGEAFPSLVLVLQGYGVTLDLVGTTFISKQGITSSTFKTVPDAPVGTFELTLPQGKFSALAANGNLCTSKLTMPTEFAAQNGAVINQNTPVSVTGCAKKKILTRAQKLKAALKACKHKAKAKRASCKKSARRKYGPVAAKHKK
jgi:hypothetical protein